MSILAISIRYHDRYTGHPPSTLEYAAWLDAQLGPPTGPAWLPSQWVRFLQRVDYLPGWTIEVEVVTDLMCPTVKLIAWAPEIEHLGMAGCTHLLGGHFPESQKEAGMIIDRMLLQVHGEIHRKAMRVRES